MIASIVTSSFEKVLLDLKPGFNLAGKLWFVLLSSIGLAVPEGLVDGGDTDGLLATLSPSLSLPMS